MKPAQTSVPLHPILADRWSGRAFESREVSERDRTALLEAARWAPSGANEQPWRFVTVERNDESRAAVVAALSGTNSLWAGAAPLLIAVAARSAYEKNAKPNRYAWHDTGLATAQLLAEATALGLATHVMAGWDGAKLREAIALPEGFEPVSVIAVGHRAAAETLPEELRERELAPRTRRPLEAIAFRGRFGVPVDVAEAQAIAERAA